MLPDISDCKKCFTYVVISSFSLSTITINPLEIARLKQISGVVLAVMAGWAALKVRSHYQTLEVKPHLKAQEAVQLYLQLLPIKNI